MAEEPPVDGRVEGAIESLNAAIANLNTVEDTRTAAEAAAARAADLVRKELEALDSSHAWLDQRIRAFMEARRAASDAIELARTTEATWKDTVAAETAARDKVKAMQSNPEQRPWAPLAKRELQEAGKRAKEAKQEARRASRVAEERAVKLGEVGLSFERAGYTVPVALQTHVEYSERRAGLEEVLRLNEARLAALEAEKEVATQGVGEAMESLEALSEEIREVEGGVASGHAEGSSVSSPTDKMKEEEEGGEVEWRAQSEWRSSGQLDEHDSEDSFAGDGWSESENEIDEPNAPNGGLAVSEESTDSHAPAAAPQTTQWY